MKVRKFTRWAVFSVIATIALMALAACGGDDSTSGGPGSGPGSSSGSSGNIATGSDENYVADLCKATKKFTDDLAAATKDPTKLQSGEDIGKLFGEPFEAFAKSVSKAKPPSDLKDYHSQIVKTLNDAAAKIKTSKDLSALSTLGDSTIPDPPQAARDRLQKVAEKNKDCTDSGFDFGK